MFQRSIVDSLDSYVVLTHQYIRVWEQATIVCIIAHVFYLMCTIRMVSNVLMLDLALMLTVSRICEQN